MAEIVMKATALVFVLGVAACAQTPSSYVHQATPASLSPQQSSLTYYSNTVSPIASGAASNPAVEGATGRTIVIGDHSTIHGDAWATQWERGGSIVGGGN